MNEEKYICNMCGRELIALVEPSIRMTHDAGYGSKYDLTKFDARFCVSCFDKLLDHMIDHCKISPIVGEYEIVPDRRNCCAPE